MVDLKTLSREAIARALEKAERYRLLNEPVEAESICLDVLRLEPDNQQALTALLLALTDQFDEDAPDAVSQALELVPRFKEEYARAYYAGIVAERRAKARLSQGGPASGHVAHDFLREAMVLFDLRHPAITQIFNFGVLGDGAKYLTMELVEGETLRTHLDRKGPLAPSATHHWSASNRSLVATCQ